MNVVQSCLALVPIPWLQPAFASLQFIYTSIIEAHSSSLQLADLAESCGAVTHGCQSGAAER